MKRHPFFAGVFSILVPGAGQIYTGQAARGAAILFAVLVVGNLNAIRLSVYALEIRFRDSLGFWLFTLPKILHDLFAFYGIVFLAWQIADDYFLVKNLEIHRRIA